MHKTALKLSAASLIAVIAGGCLGSTGIKVEGCTVFAPIYGSKKDTLETRNQVDAHNAKGIGACGWKP
jgi:hypothetical protein